VPGLEVFLFGVIVDEAADCIVAGWEIAKASFGGCCDGGSESWHHVDWSLHRPINTDMNS